VSQRLPWIRVESALDEALGRPTGERVAWLVTLGQTDPELRREVERLLGALDASPGFLERSAAAMVPDLVATSLDEAPAAPAPAGAIGPYRIVRELGRGGMGSVYLAERGDGEYRRLVAIKVVRAGLGWNDDDRRFRTERQILASIDHPGVARLLDGGTTPDGTAYLVMEYVDGDPIDRYAARQALSVDQRLALFDQVASAVEYAHQRLVVHRDLKPANILVTAQGEAKLLDFGIAKLLEGGEDAEITRTGVILATPAYASPEQIRGEAVSVASDVYALGVLLYQLLADRGPYRLPVGALPQQWAAAICDEIPERPSAVAADPDRRRELAGDLDAIVRTALAKEPDRRYPSVAHFRDDLRRHRQGLPVTARPATRRYLLGKFVARHRPQVVGTAIGLLAMAAGAAAAVWQARTASRQAERAERVTRFVETIFEVADPDRSRGEDISARELLDRGAARLGTDLGTEPTVRADLLAVVAGLYQRLGRFDSAGQLLQRAIALDSSSQAAPLDRADRISALASIRHDLGDYPAAESLATVALSIQRRHLSADHPVVTATMSEVGAARGAQGDYPGADSLLRRALAIERRRGDSLAVASAAGRLGHLEWRRGRYPEAVPLLEEALGLERRFHGETHTRTATSLQRLAAALADQGAFDSATALLDRAIATRERLLGADHPLVASAVGNLADLYQKHGRLDLAEGANLRALTIRSRTLGDAHPDVALSYNNLAVVQFFRIRYPEAIQGFERALAIWRPLLGDEHPTVLSALNNLGSAHRAAGDLAAAERMLAEVLAIRLRVLGESHQDVAQSRNNLALLHAARGKVAEAETGFGAATRIWRSALGGRHVNVAFGLVGHGRLLSDRGRCREAEPLLSEAVAIRQDALDSASTDLALARREWAICLGRLGRRAEAISLLERVVPVLRERWGPSDVGTTRATAALAEFTAP
jgi:serine/threonine protein kinase/tetratricopeptide (TPR) repeat protein